MTNVCNPQRLGDPYGNLKDKDLSEVEVLSTGEQVLFLFVVTKCIRFPKKQIFKGNAGRIDFWPT